ncbi:MULTISPECIES: flavin-containing monooxygenase [Micromonospora]|uniref:Predicted flavoprotein CzcO associated with the cation diffusion facilitator CzcD n=1 Tax=Micromonospora yangpuensis TaxID=683228 RepID=A0A1C6V0J1_9ACTN|nr:NAD(P)-binding domain-containing protein [Micromonospora yangpuensis]GGL96915.1 monooxygenase [Micromonospora yangpuensis]SCL59791.1 Predicted flavoprotein CzcO associated with the cation diffusion facilitator CzcD [Micromonospora yangpuensis]
MSSSADHGRPEPDPSDAPAPDGRSVADRGETVCVIGAGASGLVAVKNLREHGFGVDCYERETSVGGAWNWRHDRSPVYASTHLISSRPFTQFPDFPMPDDWPDYPHHSQLLSYFERYADHFDLRSHVWFGTEVVRVEPAAGHRWDVTTRSTGGYGPERTSRYAAVVVANGHNWSPKLPDYPGLEEFRGEIMHASSYKDPTQLRGKRVLVVGAGNTGCDIAVEAAQQASACWHSSRRGYWYAPKYVLGRPADQVNDLLLAWRVPLAVRQWLYHRLLRLTVGDLTRFGLPKPDHRVYETHPIANSQLVYYAGHGALRPVPDVARFHGGSVELTDGRRIEPELVVFATGYLPRFEFLDPAVLGDTDGSGRPRLWLNAFAAGHPTLAVAGLVQPDSGIFALSHWQTVLFARLLRSRVERPERAAAFAERVAAGVGQRYSGRVKESSRHWFEVAHADYLRAVQRALHELEGK